MEINYKDIIFEPEVQNFCISSNFSCPNYNRYWACPPKAPYMEQEISKYDKFYLVYVKFDLKSYVEKEKKNHPNRSVNTIKNRFFAKQYLRDDLEKEVILFLETSSDNYSNEILILWDGHCRVCEKKGLSKCSLVEDLPCRYPESIRYSMEAVGIHVTKTVKKLSLSIEWPPQNYYYRFALICLKN